MFFTCEIKAYLTFEKMCLHASNFNILPHILFSFGMYHDTEKIGCSKREGDTLHVMTPTFEVDAVGVAWSRCSRRDITNFLE